MRPEAFVLIPLTSGCGSSRECQGWNSSAPAFASHKSDAVLLQSKYVWSTFLLVE